MAKDSSILVNLALQFGTEDLEKQLKDTRERVARILGETFGKGSGGIDLPDLFDFAKIRTRMKELSKELPRSMAEVTGSQVKDIITDVSKQLKTASVQALDEISTEVFEEAHQALEKYSKSIQKISSDQKGLFVTVREEAMSSIREISGGEAEKSLKKHAEDQQAVIKTRLNEHKALFRQQSESNKKRRIAISKVTEEIEKEAAEVKRAADMYDNLGKEARESVNWLKRNIDDIPVDEQVQLTEEWVKALERIQISGRGSVGALQKNFEKLREGGVRSLQAIRGGAEQATRRFGKWSEMMGKFMLTFGALRMGSQFVQRFAEQIGQASEAAFNLAENSAKLIDQQTGFRRLASTFQNEMKNGLIDSSVAMNRITIAADGAIDELQLMQSATQAALVGISPDKFDDIVVSARALAAVTGRDATEAVDRLTSSIAKQERRLLDELGIVVRAEDLYASYAKAHDLAAASLTAEQKVAAFLEGTLEKVEDRVTTLGGVLEQAQSPFIRFRAAVRNTNLAIGEYIRQSPTFQAILKSLTNIINSVGDAFQDSLVSFSKFRAVLQEQQEDVAEYTKILSDKEKGLPKIRELYAEILSLQGKDVDFGGIAYKEARTEFELMMKKLKQEFPELTGLFESLMKGTGDFEAAMDGRVASIIKSARSAAELRVGLLERASPVRFMKAYEDQLKEVQLQKSLRDELDKELNSISVNSALERAGELEDARDKLELAEGNLLELERHFLKAYRETFERELQRGTGKEDEWTDRLRKMHGGLSRKEFLDKTINTLKGESLTGDTFKRFAEALFPPELLKRVDFNKSMETLQNQLSKEMSRRGGGDTYQARSFQAQIRIRESMKTLINKLTLGYESKEDLFKDVGKDVLLESEFTDFITKEIKSLVSLSKKAKAIGDNEFENAEADFDAHENMFGRLLERVVGKRRSGDLAKGVGSLTTGALKEAMEISRRVHDADLRGQESPEKKALEDFLDQFKIEPQALEALRSEYLKLKEHENEFIKQVVLKNKKDMESAIKLAQGTITDSLKLAQIAVLKTKTRIAEMELAGVTGREDESVLAMLTTALLGKEAVEAREQKKFALGKALDDLSDGFTSLGESIANSSRTAFTPAQNLQAEISTIISFREELKSMTDEMATAGATEQLLDALARIGKQLAQARKRLRNQEEQDRKTSVNNTLSLLGRQHRDEIKGIEKVSEIGAQARIDELKNRKELAFQETTALRLKLIDNGELLDIFTENEVLLLRERLKDVLDLYDGAIDSVVDSSASKLAAFNKFVTNQAANLLKAVRVAQVDAIVEKTKNKKEELKNELTDEHKNQLDISKVTDEQGGVRSGIQEKNATKLENRLKAIRSKGQALSLKTAIENAFIEGKITEDEQVKQLSGAQAQIEKYALIEIERFEHDLSLKDRKTLENIQKSIEYEYDSLRVKLENARVGLKAQSEAAIAIDNLLRELDDRRSRDLAFSRSKFINERWQAWTRHFQEVSEFNIANEIGGYAVNKSNLRIAQKEMIRIRQLGLDDALLSGKMSQDEYNLRYAKTERDQIQLENDMKKEAHMEVENFAMASLKRISAARHSQLQDLMTQAEGIKDMALSLEKLGMGGTTAGVASMALFVGTKLFQIHEDDRKADREAELNTIKLKEEGREKDIAHVNSLAQTLANAFKDGLRDGLETSVDEFIKSQVFKNLGDEIARTIAEPMRGITNDMKSFMLGDEAFLSNRSNEVGAITAGLASAMFATGGQHKDVPVGDKRRLFGGGAQVGGLNRSVLQKYGMAEILDPNHPLNKLLKKDMFKEENRRELAEQWILSQRKQGDIQAFTQALGDKKVQLQAGIDAMKDPMQQTLDAIGEVLGIDMTDGKKKAGAVPEGVPTATFRAVTEPQANQMLLLMTQQVNFLQRIAMNTDVLPTMAGVGARVNMGNTGEIHMPDVRMKRRAEGQNPRAKLLVV